MNLQVLPKAQQDLWGNLAGGNFLSNFYLAGGTAIALHLGHRESIDFDFFSSDPFNAKIIKTDLQRISRFRINQESQDTLTLFLSDVKVSFFQYPYALIENTTRLKGISIAALKDLVAMKVIAIGQRGTKKDFVDLHAIMVEGWNLNAIFDCVEQKFQEQEFNHVHLLKSLTFFSDAEEDPMPKMKNGITWEKVKTDLRHAARKFMRT
jgi:hypothetical protein